VTILPLERVIEAARRERSWRPRTSTASAGRRPAAAGICTSCACVEDEVNLEPIGRSELKTLSEELGEAAVSRRLRLACQCGDVTVTKRAAGGGFRFVSLRPSLGQVVVGSRWCRLPELIHLNNEVQGPSTIDCPPT
jgi:hypothetical protein